MNTSYNSLSVCTSWFGFFKRFSPLNTFSINFAFSFKLYQSFNSYNIFIHLFKWTLYSFIHLPFISSLLIVALNQRSAELKTKKKHFIELSYSCWPLHIELLFEYNIKFEFAKRFWTCEIILFIGTKLNFKKKTVKNNNHNKSHQTQRENIYETHPRFPLPTWNSIFESEYREKNTFEITEHKKWSVKKFRGRIDGEHK